MTTELGGGGFLSREVIELAESGVQNVLRKLGILKGEMQTRASLGLPDVVRLTSRGLENYVIAPLSGFFETLVHLGDGVTEGQPVGRMHFSSSRQLNRNSFSRR